MAARKKSKSEKQSKRVTLPVTEAEHRTIKAAARRKGVAMAEWARDALLNLAGAASR